MLMCFTHSRFYSWKICHSTGTTHWSLCLWARSLYATKHHPGPCWDARGSCLSPPTPSCVPTLNLFCTPPPPPLGQSCCQWVSCNEHCQCGQETVTLTISTDTLSCSQCVVNNFDPEDFPVIHPRLLTSTTLIHLCQTNLHHSSASLLSDVEPYV